MIIAPETEIYLLKAPLEVDELHQLDFANETAQVNYFQSLPKLALMRATYQRENGTMWVNFNIEQIRNYNYVMYKNKQYSNKWFYAFIIGMEYENNTTTGVKIKTDVFQTYLFEYQWKRSYIKRETVADDTFGKHLIPEEIDTGEYILNSTDSEFLISNTSNYQNKSALIVVQCSQSLGKCYTDELYTTEIEDMYVIGGLPQGCWYYMFYNTSVQVDALRQLKRHLDAIGKGASIMNIFIAPAQSVDTQYCVLRLYDKEGNISSNYCSCYVASGNTYLPKTLFTKTLTRPTSFGNFTPKNNKTLTGQFNYFLVSNNAGNAMPFKYEDFNGNPNFSCIGTLSVMNSFCLLPNNSKKSQHSEYGINTEMLQGTPLPCLSWNNDYYLNWLAQNNGLMQQEIRQWGRDMAFGVGTTALNSFASSLNSGGGSMNYAVPQMAMQTAQTELAYLYQGLNLIDNITENIKAQKVVPDSVSGNLGAGDLAFSIFGSVGYKFYNYQVRPEIAQKVDRYFDMFGYRVNEIKTPNTKTRRYWNFIQTTGANIVGDIPQEATGELKALFNSGLTIWHDPAHFLDYTMTNSIL